MGGLRADAASESDEAGGVRQCGGLRTGSDARTRRVQLTDRARKLARRMRAEWVATEEVLAELEAETPYALSRAVADLNAALDRKSFYDRFNDHLPTTESNR